MKGWILTSIAFLLIHVNAAQINAKQTSDVKLQKRKDVVINKDYEKYLKEKAKQDGELEEEEEQKPVPWVRIYSSTITAIVTPTVIAGVTFSTRPPKTTDGLEPWISLNKEGSPKTIKPKMKNGIIKNGSPTYKTYFATPTTVTMNKEMLKAQNMADDETFTEVQYIPENKEDHELIPIIRCTPDFYSKKGRAKKTSSAPFCFPHDNAVWLMDKTYFVTWYSKFFDKEVTNVKLHLSYIKQSQKQKGLKKRDLRNLFRRSSEIERGGKIQEKSIFVTDWISKDQGYFPITILESWLDGEYEKKVLLTLQPDNVADEEFDHLDKYMIAEIRKGSKVNKEKDLDLKKLEDKWRNQGLGYDIEDDGIDYEKYFAMLAIPTSVVIACFLMYVFLQINKGAIDLSHLKKRQFAREKTTHRRIPFKRKADRSSELPQYNSTVKND